MAINIRLENTKDITLNTANKYCTTDINIKLDSALKSRYILKDKSILGVQGELIPAELTYDTTATENDILKSKTAWVNGEKIRGAIDVYTGKTEALTEGGALFDIESDLADSLEGATSTSEGLEIVNGVVVGIGTCTDTEIILGKELLGIGKEAFSDCDQIISINIESGMTFIETHAFLNCANLEEVIIPETVTDIADGIFSGCSNLSSVTIPYVHKRLSMIEHNFGYFFGEKPYQNSIEVPQHVWEAPYYARKKIYYLPKTLLEVKLTNGNLNTGDSYYGSPFENCSMIESISIGKNVVLGSKNYNPFKGCTNLYYITVEEGHKTIDSREFSNAIIYTSTNTLLFGCANTIIPESVKELASGAFNYCTGLTSINIGAGVTNIAGNPFIGCSSLTKLVVDSENTIYDSRNNSNAIIRTASNSLISGCRTTIVPEGIISIGREAFKDITSLTTLNIPSSVKTIGGSAFNGCSELININSLAGVTSIGSYAFQDCSSLKSIDLSSFQGQIPYACFDECTALSYIKFGKDITSIDDHAFSSCAVSEIIFPEGSNLKETSYHCLDENNSLRYVVLPDGMTTIGECTFYLCDSLEKIIIPTSVTLIDWGAFWSSDFLKVYYKGTKEDWDKITIESHNYSLSGFYSDTDIYYYSETKPATLGSYWYYDSDGITPIIWELDPDDYLTGEDGEVVDTTQYDSVGLDIRGDTLYGPGSCKDKIIKVPEGITRVVNPTVTSNFSVGCRYPRCTTMILPESLQYIGEKALTCGDNLISINIPNSVSFIGESAFHRNESLQHIVFPEGISVIPYRVLASCPSLESVVIPKTITEIEVCMVTSGNYDLYYKGSLEDWHKIKIGSGSNFESIHPLDHAKNFYVLDDHGSVEFEGNTYSPLYEYTLPADATSYDDYDKIRPWSNLESLKVAAGNTVYDSRNNCNAIIKTSSNSLMLGCKNTVIPSTVTSIGSQAFYNCRDLQSINLPASIKSIGQGAFFGCSNLTEINISDGFGPTLPSYAFYGTGITHLTIPGSVKEIDGYSVAACNKLKTVTLNEGVNILGKYAFSWSDNIISMVLPKSLTTIEEIVFWEDSRSPLALTDIYYRGSKEDWKKISIGSGNQALDRVRIHYDYVD